MSTRTASRDAIDAAATALGVWSERAESDNARDLQAGVERMTDVHAAIYPIYVEQEQEHLANNSGAYKMETFYGYIKAAIRGKGIDFNYTLPDIQSIIDWAAHDDDNLATFVLWVAEDAKARKVRAGRDVKVKAPNFSNYQDWLSTVKARVLDPVTKKMVTVDRYTPTGRETKLAKAERERREGLRETEAQKQVTDGSFAKLFGEMTGKSLVEAAKRLQHDVDRFVNNLKAEYLAVGEDGKPVSDDNVKAWNDGIKAYNAAKSAR